MRWATLPAHADGPDCVSFLNWIFQHAYNTAWYSKNCDQEALQYNGINWSTPCSLIQMFTIPLLGQSIALYLKIIWDEASSTQGCLIYAHSFNFGHEQNNKGIRHYMVGIRSSFKSIN
jgi:hypothetical protein